MAQNARTRKAVVRRDGTVRYGGGVYTHRFLWTYTGMTVTLREENGCLLIYTPNGNLLGRAEKKGGNDEKSCTREKRPQINNV